MDLVPAEGHQGVEHAASANPNGRSSPIRIQSGVLAHWSAHLNHSNKGVAGHCERLRLERAVRPTQYPALSKKLNMNKDG